uniref:Uncharacterized protein n=1 Tax=Arundo donax TaxID=35708 RepID=A0A0A9QD75_ARUDO
MHRNAYLCCEEASNAFVLVAAALNSNSSAVNFNLVVDSPMVIWQSARVSYLEWSYFIHIICLRSAYDVSLSSFAILFTVQ